MSELGKYAVPVLVAWGAGLGLLAALLAQTLLANARARAALERVERDRAAPRPPEGTGR